MSDQCEFCIFLTMLKSSFSRLTVICGASDGSTPASCVLPLERFTGQLWTKTPGRGSQGERSPTCSWDLVHDGETHMTGRSGDRWWKSLRRWGGGEGVMRQEYIPLCFWGLKSCRLRHRDGSSLTFIIQKNTEFINFCQLSFCLLHVDLSSLWVSGLPQLRYTVCNTPFPQKALQSS